MDNVPVNVLFVHTGGGWIRGSENALLMALRGLDRRRVTPFLFCGNPLLAQMAYAEEIETTICPMPQIMVDCTSVKLQIIQWVRTLNRMLSVIRNRNIQLVYCNGGSTCQVGNYAAKAHGIPVICHVHSPYNRRYIYLYRIHHASRVIVVSQAVERCLRSKVSRVPCEVVYNGVDTARFQPAEVRDGNWRERLGLPRDSVIFGQVSSLIPRKGIDILLRAFVPVSRRYSEAYLVLVGDGPQGAEFTALASRLGVESKVRFAGNHADTVPFYQHVFDVNVLASRSDAFPLSILEAAACGLPVIGASVDGIPEAVLDNRTGLLFEAENDGMLAEKMSLLACAPEMRKRFGAAGRQLAMNRFSMEQYCGSIEQIILEQHALGRARRAGVSDRAVVS